MGVGTRVSLASKCAWGRCLAGIRRTGPGFVSNKAAGSSSAVLDKLLYSWFFFPTAGQPLRRSLMDPRRYNENNLKKVLGQDFCPVLYVSASLIFEISELIFDDSLH